MSPWSRWGAGGPPPEAYSRVTNPERFRPLHDVAQSLLDRLEATCDVERAEGYGIDQDLEKLELARPPVKLVPSDPDAAPLVIAFMAFPGVGVRVGRWCQDYFPGCGCDACDETADGEASRLANLVDDVTAGRFREAVHLPPAGDGWKESAFWSLRGSSKRRARIERSHALRMLAESGGSTFDWKPWPIRGKAAEGETV